MTKITPFQFSLATELGAFRPEIDYACQFLERAHGLRLSGNTGPTLHYGPNPPVGAVSIPAVFFPHGARLSDRGTFPDRGAITSMFSRTSSPFLFPPDGKIGCFSSEDELSYDALGLIFFLLSRIEEREPPYTDQYDRFPYAVSFFNQMGGPGKPWADHAARDIAVKLLRTETPPNHSQYAVILTHDVDRLKSYHKVHLPLRYALGDLVKRRAPLKAVKTLQNNYFSGEPWNSINKIIELSESKGLVSRFFFMGPSHLEMDSTYALKMVPLLTKITAHITNRGHLIGFHPGYDTATNQAIWRKQKESLEDIIYLPLTDGRQHVLRYEIETTPAIWAGEAMKTDYTMAFPDMPGFRTGTCRAFAAYDLKNRQALSVDLVATPITDFGLLGGKYQNLSVSKALDICQPIIQACRDFGGNLCILFHTSNQDDRQNIFYESLLERLP